ncbi:MAG: ribonuclease HI [Chitinophagaceae bacterium]|jgi:ribonuclease HI|nr:MAG: ribonuclease HI [Chitinophagaceae bacterium]
MPPSPVTIYTDGSSRGNPGPGGFGVILIWKDHRKEISAGYRLTTNNRMELMGVITALEALKKEGQQVSIYTDSQYIVNSVEKKWVFGWIKTGFKGKKNKDLWLRFLELYKKHAIRFIWVKGHADNPFNNRCDELATQAADGTNLSVDMMFEKEQRKGNNSLL